jgi:methionyl aminopeptidase
MINIKSSREIDLMRRTCELAANTLVYIEPYLKPGVSTLEINNLCHDYIVGHGAYPSPLNYHGFPKSICTSINEVICHGIPTKDDILKDGDIVNIDITTYLNKFHGDTSKTFLIGNNVTEQAKRLVDIAYQCMMIGIEQVKPNGRIGDIGSVIAELAHEHGYSVVVDYCGHGIGRDFHEEPQVVHDSTRGTGEFMRPGMIFTIEPMINLGTFKTKLLKDKWTVVTLDGKLSAQFEHTILVTETGYEILTLSK